jgi:multimeric flavodoxin WrbA
MVSYTIPKCASIAGLADLTSETKALIDRAGYVARANGDMFQRKVGAAVVAVRRADAMHTFDSINHFFLIGQILGQNMAWLLKKINA